MFSDDDETCYYFGNPYMYDTEDSEPYYDDDDYYDDDFGIDAYTVRMLDRVAHLRATCKEETACEDNVAPVIFQPKSLVDVCCKYLALNFPFAYLQDRFPPVPDDLQLKVITYSFPENEDQIRKYAEFSRPSVDLALPKAMCNSDIVTNMMQIGFRLSANVDSQYVTIHFDRGKITLAQCSCGDSSGWCFHVLATALKRIKHVGKLDKSQFRLPVSDALNTLSREQLLKFSQYLLYHHQNHKIVETAQGLIDKLVNQQGNYGDEDINVVQGAPDPTAGPGLDEESHWFMCSKGFKEKCGFINHESLQALGFECLETYSENEFLRDLWYKNRCQPPLVKDEVDVALGTEFYSCQRRYSVSLNILETVLELLQDDSTTGLISIKSCTEQVVSRLSRRSQRSFTHPDPANKFLSHSSVSPAMGFTARPFRSWTFCDELSRLWQVAVLNPKLKPKERKQVAQELFHWNEEVQKGCNADLLVTWKGLEVAYNLCQYINWNSLEMQGFMDGSIPAHYSISGIILVEVQLEDDQILQCHLPYCFTYGSITLDILTWCTIIHTLEVFNYHTTAVHIGFCLSIALIALYQNNADTRSQISGLPIIQKCCLDYRHLKNVADHQDNTNQKTPKGAEKKRTADSSETELNECWCPLIWPSDALFSLRCVAFLYNVLWSNKDKVEPLITKQRQQHAIGTTKFSNIVRNILGTESLVFQVGAIGLLLPKFPMTATKQEVELYDIENWLTFQLFDLKLPSPNDLDFLHSLCQTAKRGGPHRLLAPCSSFTRVVLHHNFKELSTLSDDVLELVFHTLEFPLIHINQACPQNLFEFSFVIQWCKLAELTLSIFVVDKTSHMERTIKYLLNKNGILGEGLLKLQLSSDDVRNRHLLLSTLRAKSWICFALAKALLARIKRSSKNSNYTSGHKCISVAEILTGVTDRTLKVFPPISSPSDIMSLKKLAICLGAHSAYLEKTSDRYHSDGSAVRWLIETAIDCGLWGVSCLLSSHDDVTDFLQHDEAIVLCRQLLKKKDDCGVNMVKEVLLSLLRHAVNAEAVNKIKDILQICSEYKDVCSILVPWLCEHLRDMARSRTIHYESLFCASEEMFRCYKERLFQTIIENQRLTNLDGNFGLRQLFAEESDDETEEQYKPCPFPNPYMTSHPHPFMELSFELGMMGLNALPSGDNSHAKRGVYLRRHEGQRLKRGHLKQLCDLVCYITHRKWLHQVSAEHKDMLSLSGSVRDDIDESYLTRLVNDLLKSDMSAMALMTLLCEIACKLQVTKDTMHFDNNPELKKEILHNVVQEVPHLRLLLDRIEIKFKNLLLGSKMKEIVKSVKRERRSSPRELRVDLEYCKLEDSTLRDTLIAAKVVHEVRDPSGMSFEKLIQEIENTHKELKTVLDGIVSGEEVAITRDDEVFLNPFFLWPFISQEYVRRHSLEDFLN